MIISSARSFAICTYHTQSGLPKDFSDQKSDHTRRKSVSLILIPFSLCCDVCLAACAPWLIDTRIARKQSFRKVLRGAAHLFLAQSLKRLRKINVSQADKPCEQK